MSAPETKFESVVELAASVTGAPVCLLTKVEKGGAGFLATKGISLDENGVEGSFCEATIENPGSWLEVPDSREDPRFPDEEGPGLCFDDKPLISYIGVPVLDRNGLRIGAICAMDTVPRNYPQEVRDSLDRLAEYASSLIEVQTHSDRSEGSDVDPLTRLPNRAAVVGDSRIYPGQRDMVAVADLSGMTEINVDLGRDYGDLVLKEIAGELREAMPDSAQVARVGGDSFAVVGSASTGWEKLAVDMLAAIKGPFETPDEGKIQLSAAIGVAVSEGSDELMGDLMGRAESAMKLAKRKGPGSVLLAAQDAVSPDSRQARIRNHLHGSLSGGEFNVAYQTIVDLKTGSAIGTEALCRWHHPELGAVAPDEFIPMMEETGLIRGLTDFVLATALHDLGDGQLPGQEVSVNLSPSEIDRALPGRIRAALKLARVEPTNLVLEVTEKINELNREEVLVSLRDVSDMGVRLAIDDFGAGSTSVAQLRSFPISRLKLDRTLVQDLGGADSSRAEIVIQSMAGIADGLGIDLVAEGVETEIQAELLRKAQVRLAQGWLFSRAEAIGELGLPAKVAAEAEDLAESFFERTSDMAFISKANRIIHWNRHFQDRLGWSEEEIRSSTLADLFHPGDRASIQAALEDPGLDSSWGVEARIRTREGAYIDTFLSVTSDTGRGTRVVAAADISRLKKLEETGQRLNSTLTAIAELQDEYIGRGLSRAWWEKALARVVEVSECGFGFVGRITEDENGDPILHSYALSDIAWNDWSRSVFDEYFEGGLQFKEADSLYGATMARGETVLTNDAPHDHRAGGTPEGHPALRNYAGIPLVYEGETIGMLGLANRAQGMDEELVELLEPLTSHLAQVVHLDRKIRASGVLSEDSAGIGAERSILPKLQEIERLTARAMPAVLSSESAADASVVIRNAVTELVPNANAAFQGVEGGPLPNAASNELSGVSRLSCRALATGTPKISKPGLMLDSCEHADPRCYATFCVPINGEGGQIGLVSVSVPSAVDLSSEQPATVADSMLQMLVTLTSGLAMKVQPDVPTEPA